jgi:uncharacterized protein with NRDE domain
VCLITLAHRCGPDWPLVIAANRDEFHERPTQAAGWWVDRPDILGGRDLLAGGSWLAVHRLGRFAAVTNYRDAEPRQTGLSSRGELVAGFLETEMPPMDYLATIDGARYNGFNLLVWAGGELAYLSNQGDASTRLGPGIYGLANARLDSSCDKVSRSKARLRDLLDNGALSDAALFELLGDRATAPPGDTDATRLPRTAARAITAPFIVMPEFGTRCSTLVTVSNAGEWRFVERRFGPEGRCTGETLASFSVTEDP